MAAKLSVVVPASTGPKPARTLGKHGATLWRAIMSEYQIEDSGGIEMLTAACQQLDRAESLREQIDSDGVLAFAEHVLSHSAAMWKCGGACRTCRPTNRAVSSWP